MANEYVSPASGTAANYKFRDRATVYVSSIRTQSVTIPDNPNPNLTIAASGVRANSDIYWNS